MTNALLLCSLIVGEWMCLIWRERCRCYRRYNSQLRCESPRQTLTSVKETQSTPLFTLCRRCLPAWRRLPSLLCIWLQGSGSKRGSQEAGSGRPVWWNALRCYRESRERFTVRSAFTLQILADVMFQGDAPLTQEGGSLYRSRTRWQKSQELTESRWLQLMTFQLQERVFKAEIQQTIWHYNISKYWMTVLMNWGGKDRLYFGFHVSNFEALSFTVLWAFRHADSSVFSLVLFCILLLVVIRFVTTSERSDCSVLNNNGGSLRG